MQKTQVRPYPGGRGRRATRHWRQYLCLSITTKAKKLNKFFEERMPYKGFFEKGNEPRSLDPLSNIEQNDSVSVKFRARDSGLSH